MTEAAVHRGRPGALSSGVLGWQRRSCEWRGRCSVAALSGLVKGEPLDGRAVDEEGSLGAVGGGKPELGGAAPPSSVDGVSGQVGVGIPPVLAVAEAVGLAT